MSTGTTADLGIGGNFVGLAACAALEVGTALFGEFVRGLGAGFGSGAGGSCTGLPLTMLPPTVGSLNVNVSAIVPRLAGGVVALATRGPLFAPLSGVEGGPFVVSAPLFARGPGFGSADALGSGVDTRLGGMYPCVIAPPISAAANLGSMFCIRCHI
jgi:hypothetical protein